MSRRQAKECWTCLTVVELVSNESGELSSECPGPLPIETDPRHLQFFLSQLFWTIGLCKFKPFVAFSIGFVSNTTSRIKIRACSFAV